MSPRQAKRIGALGGKVTGAESEAKAAALRALHRARRGVRLHADTREREVVLAALAAAVREPKWGVCSVRQAALHVGVSARTVHRWLSGEDWPPQSALRALERWLRRVQAG